jgi:hypothetical protein
VNRGGGEAGEDETQRTLDPILDANPPRDDALDVRVRVAVRPRHGAAGGADVRLERGGRIEEEDVGLCGGVD